ncbi:MAG TPA: hypothetical protein VK162_25515 [Streptosporangiaceae bacterium]|nr:hypothetical protein [Streptosporangiaceae bacterium]
MTRHVGAETLARYREGDLGSRKSARIRAHLPGCPRCTALDEDLAGVTALLASAPAPAMPDQVTDRIQAALRAEAAQEVPVRAGRQPGRSRQDGEPGKRRQSRQHGEPGKRPQSRHAASRDGTVQDGTVRRLRLPELQSRLAVRVLGAAAAVVVVSGGIYGVIQLAAGGVPAATSGAAGSMAGPLRHAAAQPAGPSLTYGPAGRPAGFTPVSTGTDFQLQQLASQVSSVLRRSAPQLPTASIPAANASPSSSPSKLPGNGSAGAETFRGIAVSALQGCVTRIAAGGKVLLVDVARYQSRPATVIVVARGPGDRRIFVVGPACSSSDSDVIAQASLPGAS